MNGSLTRNRWLYFPQLLAHDCAQVALFICNIHYESLKEIESNKLLSPEGSKIFTRRKIEMEPVFGQVKANLGFVRFHLRGKEKVKVDIGLAFMANNFKKYRKMKIS